MTDAELLNSRLREIRDGLNSAGHLAAGLTVNDAIQRLKDFDRDLAAAREEARTLRHQSALDRNCLSVIHDELIAIAEDVTERIGQGYSLSSLRTLEDRIKGRLDRTDQINDDPKPFVKRDICVI